MQRKRKHSTSGKIKFNTNRDIGSERSAVDDLVVIFNIFQIDFAPTDDETYQIVIARRWSEHHEKNARREIRFLGSCVFDLKYWDDKK